MNEHIKRFAEQAGSTHKQSLGVYQFFSYELEKFAELIVKECARVAETYVKDENLKLVEHVEISSWQLQDRIKEHFGIE